MSAILAAANERAEDAHPYAGVSCRAVRLKVHGDLGAIEHDWRVFEATTKRTAFQSFDWLAKWHQRVGRRRNATPAIVTGRDGGGRLLFILPLMVERRGLIRRLTWLGSDLCDYNAPLLAPEFARSLAPDAFAGLWRDVVRLLGADRRLRFDLVDLAKMPDTVDGQPNPFLALAVRASPSNAYAATLGDDWCDVEVKLHDYVAAATVRGWPVAIATALYRHTKRFIKQTPALWRAFTRAPAMAASLSPRRPRRRPPS